MHNALIQSLLNDLKPEHIDLEALISDMLDGEQGEEKAIVAVAGLLNEFVDTAALALPPWLALIVEAGDGPFFNMLARLLIARIKAKKAPAIPAPADS
jgi:hypothetical protein